ncbi:nucleotide exchange factor GrpE [Galbitalea soli]|uniref:Protein GrpE n=1 Tax=Galbitalea soli TaxID=1268042 RepID=A0A7C9PNR6_9MICO|nr:nucleotide exchange factor GrpE [Galbitalea soli]NEM91873.1 nucleotide exchange factor GrpE [Galbitalea soli]NYJ29291.1 molecular chaperone GrpE [Galbitalea soli]
MADNGKKKPDSGEGAENIGPTSEDGDTADVAGVEDLIAAEGPDVETLTEEEISFLEEGERELLDDMRNDLARAQAELVNFRKRVERDRAANRDAVIAEVIRTLLPAIDDLARAQLHGDLAGSPLELVAQKLRAGFERYGLRIVGEKGETFDPNLHEALVQLPTPGVTVNTVADVIEPGYALGDRLLRAAKVAVSVPDGS